MDTDYEARELSDAMKAVSLSVSFIVRLQLNRRFYSFVMPSLTNRLAPSRSTPDTISTAW
jgi:hypothetical protein